MDVLSESRFAAIEARLSAIEARYSRIETALLQAEVHRAVHLRALEEVNRKLDAVLASLQSYGNNNAGPNGFDIIG